MREENRQLKERLNLNSSNSSKPPSSDAPGTPRPPKQRTGRGPGGQPGHKKHERRLLPPEAVKHVVELVPSQCKGCRRRLVGRDCEPRRHQVVEVPPLSAIVTEYRSHALACSACGTLTRAPVPAHARSAFGERLGALASLLVGKYRLSRRLVKDALSDMLGVDVSVGSVVNLEGEMTDALAPAVAGARAYVQAADKAHADETGWVEGRKEGRGHRAWLWVAATARVVVVHLARNRSGKVAQALLGKDFLGILTTDLTRDFQGFIDRGGEGGRLGTRLMRERNRFFKWWHRVRDATLAQAEFEQRMKKVRRTVGRRLRQAEVRAEKKTAGMAREILQWEECLWTFVDVPGIEPTNNFGEQCIRHAVMYRKTSFGTQGPEGSRFVERIFTAVSTLKRQERGVLDFLTDTLRTHRRGLPPPSLLPLAEAPPFVYAA
ncbi:IS66 family transposase [Corallococcus sp. CA053C]|nr:IS66 family transposase [Corallococcus sp. CA053C]